MLKLETGDGFELKCMSPKSAAKKGDTVYTGCLNPQAVEALSLAFQATFLICKIKLLSELSHSPSLQCSLVCDVRTVRYAYYTTIATCKVQRIIGL
jgi:hypothetical protein